MIYSTYFNVTVNKTKNLITAQRRHSPGIYIWLAVCSKLPLQFNCSFAF